MQTDSEVTETDARYRLRVYRISAVGFEVIFRLQHLFTRPYFLKQQQINLSSGTFYTRAHKCARTLTLHSVQRRQMASSCLLLTLFSTMTPFHNFAVSPRKWLSLHQEIIFKKASVWFWIWLFFFLTGGRKCELFFFFFNTHIRVEKCF